MSVTTKSAFGGCDSCTFVQVHQTKPCLFPFVSLPETWKPQNDQSTKVFSVQRLTDSVFSCFSKAHRLSELSVSATLLRICSHKTRVKNSHCRAAGSVVTTSHELHTLDSQVRVTVLLDSPSERAMEPSATKQMSPTLPRSTG